MISKNTIKYIRSLHLKKFRQKYNKFIVEGDKICREFLQQGRFDIDAIYATEYWIETNESLLSVYPEQFFVVSPVELKQISALKTPNQVVIVANMEDAETDFTKVKEGWSLYLDGIQDPGNMGTILRIADWFGIENVFKSIDTVELFNPKVLQASMGAFLRVKTRVIDLADLKNELEAEYPIIGTVLEGQNIYEYKTEGKGIIVIGNEGNGIAEENKAHLTNRVTIPSANNTGTESLNAGVATGIVCALLCK